MRRRAFISFLGGAAAWPLAARAEQGERVRRIGVCMNLAADDPEGQARLTAFAQGLQQLGWTDGRNARIEYRWAVGDAERIRKQAEELVTLAPDVILASGVPVVTALLQATRSVPSHNLSSDRQSPGCSATARSHQDREHRSISGCRG